MSKKKPRIYFDANPLVGQKSGIGYYTKYLIESVAEANPTAEYVGHYYNFLGHKKPHNLPRAKNISFIETRLVPTKVINLLRRCGIEIPYEIFTRRAFDFAIFTNFVSSPSILNRPNLLVVHDLGFVDYPEYVSEANKKYLLRWVPKSIRRAKLLVSISNFTSQRMKQIYGREADIITPIPPLKRRLGLKKIKPAKAYILFVGNIEPRKNLVNLIRAFSGLPESYKAKYDLLLAGGKGWKDSKIIESLNEANANGARVKALGYVSESEKAKLYQNAMLYVQPSFYEGFGMPVLEAMSYGVPVICSRIPTHVEVAESAALYFDPNKPETMAKAMTEILSSPKKQAILSKLSKQQFDKQKDWSTIAKELDKKIKRIIN